MKRVLKVLVILLLIGVLGTEIYLYFFKGDNTDNPLKISNEKQETKYLVDIYSGYQLNGISFKDVKEKNDVYYKTITGLKDKELERKINSKIKDKVENLKKDIDRKHNLVAGIFANYENTLSIGFCSFEKDEYPIEDSGCYFYDQFDSLNSDLTTSNYIKIEDITNAKSIIKDQIVKIGYEELSKSIGLVCGGGPCQNPDPDYSVVEDELLSLVNKFNNNDYVFVYNHDNLMLKFKNVKILSPEMCFDKVTKDCKKYKVKGIEEPVYINQNNYVTEYQLYIPFTNIVDNLTIYDKFKTNDSIYEKDGKKVNVKFFSEDEYSHPDMIESDNSLIDYNLFYYNDEDTTDASLSVKKNLINEMKALETNKFNIYNVFGSTNFLNKNDEEYSYIYFDVRHYNLPERIYKNNREKIYLDKYNKVVHGGGGAGYNSYEIKNNSNPDDSKFEYGYEFLKDYMNRGAFFYYIYDKDGEEVQTEDFVSHDYLKSVIPDSWLSLGNYKNVEAMIKDSLIIMSEDYSYPDKLVIFDYGGDVILKYKGKQIKLTNDNVDYDEIAEQLYS